MNKTIRNIRKFFTATFKRWKHKAKRIPVPFFPHLNWYELIKFYAYGIFYGRLSMRASAIAYSFFMAIFPFLLFVLSLIPFVPIRGFQKDFIQFVMDLLPPKTHELFENILFDVATHRRESLLSIGLLLLIFFMANGINAILTGFENSVNKVYDNRKFFRQYAFSLFIAVFLVLILFITLAAIVYFEIIVVYNLQKHGFIHNVSPWILWSKRIFYFLMMLISVSILYHFGTEEGRKMPFISPGSIITTLFFILGFYLYSVYILNFNRYNQLYGSIGALLILMFMIYIYAYMLLLGHELNMTIMKLNNSGKNKILSYIDKYKP